VTISSAPNADRRVTHLPTGCGQRYEEREVPDVSASRLAALTIKAFVAVLLAGSGPALSPAVRAAAVSDRAVPASSSGVLVGAAAASARSAWAVGYAGDLASPRIQALHWNGTARRRVPAS
jgi:hypothetical protein